MNGGFSRSQQVYWELARAEFLDVTSNDYRNEKVMILTNPGIQAFSIIKVDSFLREIYISKISIKGFRNHLNTELDLSQGLSIFVGKNGQGKSNLLEAIYMLAIAKSSRTSTEIDLINWQKITEGGHVQVLGIGKENEKTIQAQIDFDVESKKDSNKPHK